MLSDELRCIKLQYDERFILFDFTPAILLLHSLQKSNNNTLFDLILCVNLFKLKKLKKIVD